MPWNDQSSGGPDRGGPDRGGPKRGEGPWGSGQRPWGQPPREPPSAQGPDLEDMLRRFRERMRGSFGGGGKDRGGARGPRGISWPLIVGLVVLGWIASGAYIVDEGERAVITRVGKFHRIAGPGFQLHFPTPFESRQVINVTGQRTIEIGCRTANNACVDEPENSLMITGDRNIVEVHFRIYYNVSDPRAFVFNVRDPQEAVRAVAESAMREVIGRRQLQNIITRERAAVEEDVERLAQEVLDGYDSGVLVLQVQLLSAAAPPAVIDAFDDVVRAGQDAEAEQNRASRYANEEVPKARGEAAQIIQQADAYRQRVVREAAGEAARFDQVYAEYRRAPRVTRDRLYIETMERVLARAKTVILDNGAGGVTYLPLESVFAPRAAAPSAPAAAPQQQPQGTSR